ncbi:hypothetical protein NEOLEDRAFT_790961 [Neolentinus lepideus HHB14362 ss-1]|uniref:Uncharacterized protein n=1 Tax=Neolentinus lepideus HHB14362 ss-1 TaxID=1314782 RepID=A0A165PK36_9AGAM|nr:hypothetical protein NEOLEDRAFT_790961 [Neolentinus lepideus HHB14362 ss-1]
MQDLGFSSCLLRLCFQYCAACIISLMYYIRQYFSSTVACYPVSSGSIGYGKSRSRHTRRQVLSELSAGSLPRTEHHRFTLEVSCHTRSLYRKYQGLEGDSEPDVVRLRSRL